MKSSVAEIHFADNMDVLRNIVDRSVNLVYVDPPFNTQKIQARKSLSTTRTFDGTGDRVGFKGQSYKTEIIGEKSYLDIHEDYMYFYYIYLIF